MTRSSGRGGVDVAGWNGLELSGREEQEPRSGRNQKMVQIPPEIGERLDTRV